MRTSRHISRILCFVLTEVWTKRRPSIWAHRRRVPRAVHPQARASSPRTPAQPHRETRNEPYGATFDLSPGGSYLATPVTRGAGALSPHRFTLTHARAF